MTSRSVRAGRERQRMAGSGKDRASSASSDAASPPRANADIPPWAKDMMSEIKKANDGITKYREETKTEITRYKEEMEKGRREMMAEMEKWTKSLEESAEARFELLRGEVKLISDKTNSLANRMNERKREVDETLNEHSDAITDMETKLKEMEKEMLKQKGRNEDLEARSRRNNIRVVGVKEGAEAGRKPSEFMAGLLEEKLGLAATPTLDIAHRAGARRDGNVGPPRAFVVRCHYYTEKEEILKKAREMERTPEGRSGNIHIFPDFTQEINNKRTAFREARGLLRSCTGVRYGLRYPATLVITPEGGQTKTFENPKNAVDYIRKELSPG